MEQQTTFKQRFKKALFAFFEKEILVAIGHTDRRGGVLVGPDIHVIPKDFKVAEIKAEIRLDVREMDHYGMPIARIYEERLEEARQALFEESMKYIKVDERSVMDPRIFPHRVIRVSLFLGKYPY